jgi:myosin heavy subunit
MANRSMKYRLEESQRKEAQIRKEADRRKQMSKRWDTSQSSKLAQLREQQKVWIADETRLKNEIAQLGGECEQLRQKLGDMEAGQLKSEQDSQAFEASKEEIRKLKEEVQQLSASQRKYQGMESQMEKSIAEAAAAEARANMMVIEITERERQLLEALKSNESQINMLKAQLEELKRASQNQEQLTKVTPMQEASLRNVQNKYAELQKQYALIKRKYQAAQASLLDLQCDMEEKRSEAYWAAQNAARVKSHDSGNKSSSSETGLSVKSRTMSDPELKAGLISLEGTFFNSTAPLPAQNRSAGKTAGTGFQSHSRPTTGEAASQSRSQGQGRTSSLSSGERYFYGRGGIQNSSLKDKKADGKKEDKKEKKSGLNFVRGIKMI